MNQQQAKLETMGLAQAQRKSRVLQYRPHIHFLSKASTVLGVIGLIATALLEASHFYNQETFLIGTSTILGILVPVAIIVCGRLFLRPLQNTHFVVDGEQMTIKRGPQETVIRYSEIESIHFAFLNFIGGWSRLKMKDGSSHSITVAVERSEQILDLITAARPDLGNADKYEAYRKTAIFYDHSWARFTSLVTNRNKFLIKYVLTAILFSITFFYLRMRNFNEPPPNWFSFSYAAGLSLLFELFVGCAIWLFTELTVLAPSSRRRLNNAPESVVRPVEFERQVEILTDLAYYLALALTMAILV